jgi:hypothetical protein
MVIGYDERVPTLEDYNSFVGEICEELGKKWFEGVSLVTWGSYFRYLESGIDESDFSPGWSDMDAVFVFPQRGVVDKEMLSDASELVKVVQNKYPVSFQVTVSDVETMSDGRFNTFTPDFGTYFSGENPKSKVLAGPDYRKKFSFNHGWIHPCHEHFTWNLRKTRQSFLFSDYEFSKDYVGFLQGYRKSLDAIVSSPKQILMMIEDGEIEESKKQAFLDLDKFFDNLNGEVFYEIINMRENPERLFESYKDKDKVLDIWSRGITFMESLAKSYVDKFPKRD